VDICPVDVFETEQEKAVVKRENDCIGCFSCYYACPSQCIEIGDVEMLRPFHRIDSHTALVERFLQEEPATVALSLEDLEEASRDVAARLTALADTVVETMGRGHRPVGRRAGAVAATHLPEVYEEKGLENVLNGLRRRFKNAFDFDFEINDKRIDLTFHPCGLCKVVEDAGQTVGDALLCELFHEYWAGLISAYLGTVYKFEIPQTGQICKMGLFPAR
jgi:hypothetical protein